MFICFFFNDTATTEIYTLSLHDALPISIDGSHHPWPRPAGIAVPDPAGIAGDVGDDRGIRNRDRKSTRLNSSHMSISYAVFCLKKKNTKTLAQPPHVETNTHMCL